MIVFDFDGVIADTLEQYAYVCDQACKLLGKAGIEDKNPFATLDPVTFEHLALTLGLPPGKYVDLVRQGMNNRQETPRIFFGMKEALLQLHQHSELAVVSAADSGLVTAILEYHGLRNLFVRVIGGDHPGNKAQKLAALAREFRVNTLDMVMVGDSVSDLDAARQSGCHAIAVGWGWQSPEFLCQRNPYGIAHSPKALTALIRRLLPVAS